MSLVRAAADDWTSTGVKSTFAVDIPWDSGDPEDDSVICTEPCGWGWRFSCRMDGAEWSPSSSGSLEKRAATITVSFDPYFVRGASYGRITFRTELGNALPLSNELFYTEFSLPAHHAETPPISVFKCHRDDNQIPTISIAVELAPGLGVALPRPLDARVEAALADTIRGAEIVDVKFYAYTRAGTSHVAHPRALCAKMDLLLGHSDLLDTYLEGISKEGFTESYLVDLDAHVLPNSEERFEEYDYMSDSDLDTDDEDQQSDPPPSMPPVASTSALAVARRMGRVVVVKGHAYRTWNALLHYLYTGKIVFRAPKSAGAASSSSSPKIPQCSAKSMYKLADAFGLTELKGLALASLKSRLTAENILDEAFSRFTSWYGEVQDIEIPILLQHLPNLTSEMKRILRRVCNGNRPYSLDVLQKVVCSVPAPNSQGRNEGPVPFSPRRLHRRPPSPTRPMYHPAPVPHYSPPRPVPMVYPGSPPRPPSRYRFSASPPPIPSPPRPAVVYAISSPRPLSGPRVLASPQLWMPSARPPSSPPSPMLYPQAMADYSPSRPEAAMYPGSPPRHPPLPESAPSPDPMLHQRAMADYSPPRPEAVMHSGSPPHLAVDPSVPCIPKKGKKKKYMH